MQSYEGVARRMAPILQQKDLRIFDDYAHNPGKIAACVSALKTACPSDQLIVVFQPHRYSRLATMFDDMTASFSAACHVVLLPAYAAGEQAIEGLTADKVAEAIRARSHTQCSIAEDFDDACSQVQKFLKKPANILTVGAGDVWQVAQKLKDLFHGSQKRRLKKQTLQSRRYFPDKVFKKENLKNNQPSKEKIGVTSLGVVGLCSVAFVSWYLFFSNHTAKTSCSAKNTHRLAGFCAFLSN